MSEAHASPRILLADCDAMFCAVARIVDPEGAGRAPHLLVGGSPEGRGVVCSASYEARTFGVRSGMPMSRALLLCPQAKVVPVPRKECQAVSREVASVLREWAPAVEPASIDEFYLSMTGTERLYRFESLEATARRIREAVRSRTGITLSIGGGTNRLVAKLAAERAKPHAEEGSGVHIVPPGEEAAFLETLDLAAIPGIGPRLQERLRAQGLVRVVEARRVPVATLRNWFGDRTGGWLHERLQGIGGTMVDPREDPRSVSREETFPVDHDDDTLLQGELLRLAERLGRDLRRAGLRASIVTLKLRDFDFQTRSASRTLPVPVSTRQAVYPVVCDLLRSLRLRRRVPVRLLGIAATRLTTGESPAQLALFPEGQNGSRGIRAGESPRDRHLATVLDRIASRFGDRAILPGRLTTVPVPGRPGKPAEAAPRRGPSPSM